MSTEEKYAAPPPAYDDATKLPGAKPVSSVPPAGVTPTATTQPQPQVVQQVVYVQPSDPAGQLMHCNRCNCQVLTHTRTYYGTFPLLCCIFCPIIGWIICMTSLRQDHYCTRCNARIATLA